MKTPKHLEHMVATKAGYSLAMAHRGDKKAMKTLLDGMPAHIAGEVREHLSRRRVGGTMRYVEETKSAHVINLEPAKVVYFAFHDVTEPQADEIWHGIAEAVEGDPYYTPDTITEIYQRVTGVVFIGRIGTRQ